MADFLPAQGVLTILANQKLTLASANSDGIGPNLTLASNNVSEYKTYASQLDSKILPLINEINAKKQQIVSICALAGASVGGGKNPPLCGLSTIASSITTQYSGIATSPVITGFGTAKGDTVGLGTTAVIAYGTIYQDTLQGYYFPNLENGVYNTTNPLENPAYARITSSSNLGIGQSTNLFINDSGGSFLGYCYAFSGPAGTCAGYASSISTLISQITAIRSNIISNYLNNPTTIKGYKHSSQLQVWSLNNVKLDNTSSSSAIDNVTNIIKNI
jgi:hypothetical protein